MSWEALNGMSVSGCSWDLRCESRTTEEDGVCGKDRLYVRCFRSYLVVAIFHEIMSSLIFKASLKMRD